MIKLTLALLIAASIARAESIAGSSNGVEGTPEPAKLAAEAFFSKYKTLLKTPGLIADSELRADYCHLAEDPTCLAQLMTTSLEDDTGASHPLVISIGKNEMSVLNSGDHSLVRIKSDSRNLEMDQLKSPTTGHHALLLRTYDPIEGHKAILIKGDSTTEMNLRRLQCPCPDTLIDQNDPAKTLFSFDYLKSPRELKSPNGETWQTTTHN